MSAGRVPVPSGIYIREYKHEIKCKSTWREWKLLPGMQWAIKFTHSQKEDRQKWKWPTSTTGQEAKTSAYTSAREHAPIQTRICAHPLEQMPLFHTQGLWLVIIVATHTHRAVDMYSSLCSLFQIVTRAFISITMLQRVHVCALLLLIGVWSSLFLIIC